MQHTAAGVRPIPTNGGDNVLNIPARASRDDRELVIEVSQRVLDIYRDSESLTGEARDSLVIERLKALEAEYAIS